MDLKILITGSSIENDLAMSLYRAFSKLGCKIKLFAEVEHYKESSILARNRYFNRIMWKYLTTSVNDLLVETIHSYKPDLLFLLKGFFIRPETLKKIKDTSSSILFNFNPDNPFNTWHYGNSNGWIVKSIPYYDVYFIWGKFLIEPLTRVGAKRIEYLPFAHDPELHYPVTPTQVEKEKYGSEITFVGTWDEEREWWVSHILDYPVSIWGGNWEKASKKVQARWKGRAVIGEEFSKVCNSSKIILNFIRKQNIPAHNMKTFEIPTCKGFMLTTRTKEQCELFEEGKEIACFGDKKELLDKITYYLERPQERERIAEAGFKKISTHTYLDRSRRILEVYKEVVDSKRCV